MLLLPYPSPAIKYNPSNVRYLWERSSLYEQVGDHKQAMDGYRRILNLLPPTDGENFMQLSRDMAKLARYFLATMCFIHITLYVSITMAF